MKRAVLFFVKAISSRQGNGASLSRIVTSLFALTGCLVALLYPGEAATVAALVSGGAVAILSRERGAPPDA